jgi:TolB-like protein/DNA-binding SARP family transcriptional activator/tetratricopeptide (TPR) repeat protein
MPTLRLFGASGVHGPDGPLGGRIAQRHPLALLALLAAAPSATLSREKLLGLLWPDSDTERARGLLNVAVHTVRKALGEAALVSVGGSLQLDEARVPSDLRAFTDALAAGEPERAVDVCAGPFLDGFYLDAEAFDGWAEGERARLAALHADALERLAETAEAAGDAVRAAAWWRRRAVHDPCDARVALRLMEALAAAGDRAGAIQHARVHEALLLQSVGAAPDAGVLALAERLRTDPAPAPEAAHPPRGPRGTALPAFAPSTVAAGLIAAVERIASAASAAATEPSAPVERTASIGWGGSSGWGGRHRVGSGAAGCASFPAFVDGGKLIERRAPTLPSTFRRRQPRVSRPALMAAAVLALVTGGAAAALYRRADEVPAMGTAAVKDAAGPVIAVLPFADRSPARDQGWRGDEVSEEIIAALARLPWLGVTARTSAFAFRDSSLTVHEIGSRLRADYVLEGSVSVVGDRLRITALLVGVAGTGAVAWSGTFDRDPRDEAGLLAVQDEIARGVAVALRPRGNEAGSSLVRPTTNDWEAYALYRRARSAWGRRTAQGLADGVALLGEAVARDSTFAEAYAGLAECYALLVAYGAWPPQEGYPRARAAAQQALRLDPTVAEAHAALALVHLYFDGDWRAADGAFARALRLKPGNAAVRQWHATYLAYQERWDEALLELRRAERLDPHSAAIQTAGGTILYYAGRYDGAIDRSRTALVMDPGAWPAHLQLAGALAQQGRYDEALAEVELAKRHSQGQALPDALRGYVLAVSGRHAEAREVIRALQAGGAGRPYVSPAYVAAVYTGLGETDAAFAWLERALQTRDDWVVYAAVEPVFAPLRTDPRFTALTRRIAAGR